MLVQVRTDHCERVIDRLVVVGVCAKTEWAGGKQSGNRKTRLGEAYARAEPIIACGLLTESLLSGFVPRPLRLPASSLAIASEE